MPIITLPDGNNLNFPKNITGLEVAEKISKSLAKQAMVISVDGELKDLNTIIDKDCSIKKYKSFNSPSTLIIKACFANDLLIFSATSKPVTFFLKSIFLPSGNVIIGI